MPDESISAISFSILFKLTLPMTDISCSSSKNSRMAVNLSVIFDLELQASSKTSKSCFLTCPFFVSTLRATVWNKRDARISSFVAPSKSARVHIVAGRQARLLVSWLVTGTTGMCSFCRTLSGLVAVGKEYQSYTDDLMLIVSI